jgi:hypothetical protein
MNGTIILSVLDDKTLPSDALEHIRLRVEEVLVGEHGKRLVRQLKGATGLNWEISQSPRPRGTQQPSAREIQEANRQRDRETQAYFQARKERRQRPLVEREAAIARLRDRGITAPKPVEIIDEIRNAPLPVSDTAGRRGDPLGTETALKRITSRKTTNTNEE